MGIRIHKAIGYGLTDVIADEDSWSLKNDPRFNPNGYMFEGENAFTRNGFTEYINSRIEELGNEDFDQFDLLLLKRQIEPMMTELYHSVVYDMEFGNPEVILFIPPTSIKNWTRYDDMIDYYDPANHSKDGGIAESVIKIDRPLWPWEAYINIKTIPPTRLTNMQYQAHNTIRNLGLKQMKSPELMLKSVGVATKEELDAYIVPIIPAELVELIKYLKIFTDDKYIYQLRPLIYGYWG